MNDTTRKIIGEEAARAFEAIPQNTPRPGQGPSQGHINSGAALAGLNTTMQPEAQRLADEARVDLLAEADRQADNVEADLLNDVNVSSNRNILDGASGQGNGDGS